MDNEKKNKGFIEKHGRAIVLIILLACLVLFAVLIFERQKQQEAEITAILNDNNSGLFIPIPIASNFDYSKNGYKTSVYRIDDKESGIILYLVTYNWGINPPASVTGYREDTDEKTPANGFKPISSSYAANRDMVPTVFRYVNTSEGRIIYYIPDKATSAAFEIVRPKT